MRGTDGRSLPGGLREEDEDVLWAAERTLRYARRRDYRGPDFGDGLSSLPGRTIPFDRKWVNLALQELVKRAPVNVRPLLGVEYRRNYQGTALFAMANWHLARLSSAGAVHLGDGVDYGGEARRLADWLVENRSTGYSGFCGGFQHELQMLDGKHSPGDPDVVSTSYAVRALLSVGDSSYARLARSAADFVRQDLELRTAAEGATMRYHLNHPPEHYTLNAGALGARLLVDLYDAFGDDGLLEDARRLLEYIANAQLDPGGWPYRHPPESSHLSMDNHHNGFIVECFQHYRAVTGDRRYDETLSRALAFYRNTLFGDDGAPNFDESSTYPRDVHASAQGIVVFTYAGDYAFARRVLEWTREHLSRGDGRFLFRKHRFHTKRVTLMRWCQAWMAYALAEYLRCRYLDGHGRRHDLDGHGRRRHGDEHG